MRHITRHINPLGLDLASLQKKDYVNPESAILKIKRKQWESGNKFLSFEEFILMDKKVK